MTIAIEQPPASAEADEEQAIMRALRILGARMKQREFFHDTQSIKDYLRLQARGLTHEVFAVMFLDVQGRLIDYERMFRGTLTQTSVYPREIVKHALAVHAASVILHHNHPGGVCLPGPNDFVLTRRLQAALALVDVQVLDHIITTDEAALSMAGAGLMA